MTARGMSSALRLCSTSSNVPVRQVSSAVRQTSPSPCTAWPSPTEKFAPGTKTGRNSEVPTRNSLLSRLPPNSRGSTDEHGPYSGRGADRHDAEERAQRNGRAPGQLRGHRRAVDRQDAAAEQRIILRQRAAQRPDQVPAPIDRELDRLDAHLQRVAGLGAAHRHRPGQDVRSGRRFQLFADRAVMRQHDRGVADIAEPARHGLDRHRVARNRR